MSQSNPKKRKAEDEAPASEEKYTSNSVMNNIRDSDKRQVKPREIVRLLETGAFSDVSVECDGTVWSLHKSILCTRSSYFAKALAGPFEEASAGKVMISEMDPKIVVEAIQFIYTGQIMRYSVKLTTLATFPSSLKHWCELFVAADYFQLEGLMKMILVRQSDFLQGIAWRMQSKSEALEAIEDETPENYWTSPSLDAFFDVVAFVYSHDLDAIEPYKKTLCEFARQIHHFVAVDARFKEHLRKTPGFGADLFCEHVYNRPQGGLMTSKASWPELCYKCGVELKAGGLDEVWLAKPPGPVETYAQDFHGAQEKTMSVRVRCMKCARKLRGKAD